MNKNDDDAAEKKVEIDKPITSRALAQAIERKLPCQNRVKV